MNKYEIIEQYEIWDLTKLIDERNLFESIISKNGNLSDQDEWDKFWCICNEIICRFAKIEQTKNLK